MGTLNGQEEKDETLKKKKSKKRQSNMIEKNQESVEARTQRKSFKE